MLFTLCTDYCLNHLLAYRLLFNAFDERVSEYAEVNRWAGSHDIVSTVAKCPVRASKTEYYQCMKIFEARMAALFGGGVDHGSLAL